jgi:hypothetical protein
VAYWQLPRASNEYAKKLLYRLLKFVRGEGEIPTELIPAWIAKCFPAYKIEEIEQMEDITPVYQAMRLWGWYDALTHAHAEKFKNPDGAIGELLMYEAHQEDSSYDDKSVKNFVKTMSK